MSTKEEKLQSLKQTIYALLVPYKNGCTIKQLTDDYYDVQGESIPFQQFGSGSLVNFLRSIQDTIYIEFNSGRHIVKCIPSQKSAHISALVAGQKITSKKGKCIRKQFRPSQFYPNVHIQPLHIPADVLSVVVDLVAKHPRGINKCEILQLIHRKMPNIYVSSQDLDEQLKQISHRVYTRGIFVYPCNPETKPPSGPSPPVQNEPIPSNANIYVGGCEDPDELHNYIDEDDFKFLPGGCTSSVSKKTNSSPRIPISRFIQDSLSNHPDLVKNETMRNTAQEKKEDSQEYSCNLDHEYSAIDISYFNNMDDDDANYFNDQNPEYVEILINDRVKIRLEKLIQKYPDGIWCAELPDKYLEEYKVPLCYVELGFSSVREFTSHLPTIFRCVPLNGTGDYKLYSATSEIVSRTNDKPVVSTLLDLHAMQGNILESETDVLPCIASIPTCKELIPDNVLTIGECVALISVESLANMDTQFQEVVVVEVFTPTFFWVQLRKHRKSFKKFMSELHRYYEDESSNYVIPSVVLEKGLNCACTYSGVWHRGIIKAVNPDLQVTVFFYDYGTLKTYPASHVRYLHRKFSHLPAQAIPCGLVNIKPYAGTKWTRTVTNEFAFKTCNIPLIATISTINEEDNSIMITLTDTSEEEDVHINDWMVERKLALHGKMVDSVEVKDLLHYVEENLLYSPERCYEDESILSQKITESEDVPINEPFILSKSSSVGKPLVAPPPGFSVPGKPITLETIMEEQLQTSSSNATENNALPVNTGISNNPFAQEMAHLNLSQQLAAEQQLIKLYNIHLKLQMHIGEAWNTLLSTCVSDPCSDRFKANVEALVQKTQLESFIESISCSKGEINRPTENTSVFDQKCTSAGPKDYLHSGAFSNSTVPNGTSTNLSESTARMPNANNPCFVPSDINNHSRQSSKSVSVTSCSNSSNSPLSNCSNGIPAMSNFYEQRRMPPSTSYDSLNQSVDTLTENFNKLNIPESHTSTYLTSPIGTFPSYLNREPRESVLFAEPSNVNTNTYNPAYRNESTNDTINNYESLNNNVIGYKETNPFKLSLAGKLRIPDSNEHGAPIFDAHNDSSTKQYNPVNNYGIPQSTVNNCPNVAASLYSYQPRAAETLHTLENSNIYSANLLHNVNENNRGTAILRQRPMYYPSAVETNNVWSTGNMDGHAFNGFIPGNPMYYNIAREARTAPTEVTPEIRTSNMYAKNIVTEDYPNQTILQEAICRRTADNSTNIFRSGKYDGMNTGNKHVNFDSSRPFEVPHTYFDKRPSQEQPAARDFDIKVPPLSSTSPICSNGLLNGNSHHLESTGSSWSPITGFTSPLLTEYFDEGYQTRPSTSSTSQSSPPLHQTFSDEESKRQFVTSETDIVKNSCVNTPTQQCGDAMTYNFETNKAKNLPQVVPNTYQNRMSAEYLIGPESQSNSKSLNDKASAKTIQIYNCGGNLLCRQVGLRGSYVHIFHYREEGWILMTDFVDVFTEFKSATVMITVLHTHDLNIESLEFDRFNFAKIPELNSKIKKMALNNEGKPYTRVHLVPLKNAIKALTKLNIVTKEEINNAITRQEFIQGSITHQMWLVIVAYGELLKAIETSDNGQWI